jgi:hypothetical protein
MGPRALAVLLGVALGTGGCQRGCLLTWLRQSGAVQDHEGIRGSGSLRLQYVDCPDGLARCVDGVVESSRLFRHPDPCSASAEECSCPWVKGERCTSGCVSEGTEVVLPPDEADHQLCAPPGGRADLYARPAFAPAPSDPGCDGDERYHCFGGVVVRCDEAAVRALSVCLRGCAEERQTLDQRTLQDEQAAALLCVH